MGHLTWITYKGGYEGTNDVRGQLNLWYHFNKILHTDSLWYTLWINEKKYREYRIRFQAMSHTILTKLPKKSARNALHVCGEKMDTEWIMNLPEFYSARWYRNPRCSVKRRSVIFSKTKKQKHVIKFPLMRSFSYSEML